MENQGDEINVYCNLCAGERDHKVLFATQREWHEEGSDERGEYHEVEQCLVASCCGCKNRAFITRWRNSDSELHVTQFPPKTVRRKPTWMVDLFMSNIDAPTKGELIDEIYAALGAGCARLALLGIRSLLEHVMVENVGDLGTFDKHMDMFELKGYISSVQRSTLGPVIEAGHASMHRAYKPSLEDVMHCLDVSENIILAIYIHPMRSSRMSIPKRSPRIKKVS